MTCFISISKLSFLIFRIIGVIIGKKYSGVRKKLSFIIEIGVIEISTVKNINIKINKIVRFSSYLISFI